jgi:hypothetical protein
MAFGFIDGMIFDWRSEVERIFLNSKALGERVFRTPGGRGNNWKRMRRRKSTINTSVEFGVRSSEFEKVDASKREWGDLTRIIFWIDQRATIKRMPSSMMEKAQISKEPKATGVKMMSSIRIDLIRILIMCA